MIMKSEELRVATRNVLEQGFMSGKGVATFAPFTIDDLYSIFVLEKVPFKEIICFLDERTTIQDLLADIENNNDYIWWSSKWNSILRVISMYSIIVNMAKAKELVQLYYKKDESVALYRNMYYILCRIR